MDVNIQGLPVYSIPQGNADARYIPLPRELWRSCGTCNCPHCNGGPAYWDTLAVMGESNGQARTWTVHAPELHKGHARVGQFGRL
jgi:hypothetical protein